MGLLTTWPRRPRIRSWHFLLGVLAGSVSSCEGSPPPAGKLLERLPEKPAIRLEGEAPAVLTFLRDRYDVDRDGVVDRGEYGRGDTRFRKLDRNADGRLDHQDFVVEGRRIRVLDVTTERRTRAQLLIAWYFQGTDGLKDGVLSESEVLAAFERYDAGGDGRVGRREFERLAPKVKALGLRPAGQWVGLIEPETTEPWDRILDGVDRDDDGFLRAAELQAFFSTVEPESWSFAPADLGPGNGPVRGAMAPEFSLPTLDDESALVTLSSFRGQRPVALIFGSYT